MKQDHSFTSDVTDLKPYTPTEIAHLYGVSWKVMNRWLKPHRTEIGNREGLYYTVLQVQVIFEKLGLPGKIEER